jgi:hypothetical protein
LQEAGDYTGITRERVRQLLLSQGRTNMDYEFKKIKVEKTWTNKGGAHHASIYGI